MKHVEKPWGYEKIWAHTEKYVGKVLHIEKGHKLSLQKHNHRSEHWIVVSGTAKIEIEGKEIILEENESCYIPLGSKHRLSNFGNEDLKIIEIPVTYFERKENETKMNSLFSNAMRMLFIVLTSYYKLRLQK